MSEVLADALVRMKNFLDRGIDFRGARQKFEVVMDALGQIQNARKERPPCRKGMTREIRQFRRPRHMRRFENEFAGGQYFRSGAMVRICRASSQVGPRVTSNGPEGRTCTSLCAAIRRTVCGSCRLNHVT